MIREIFLLIIFLKKYTNIKYLAISNVEKKEDLLEYKKIRLPKIQNYLKSIPEPPENLYQKFSSRQVKIVSRDTKNAIQHIRCETSSLRILPTRMVGCQ